MPKHRASCLARGREEETCTREDNQRSGFNRNQQPTAEQEEVAAPKRRMKSMHEAQWPGTRPRTRPKARHGERQKRTNTNYRQSRPSEKSCQRGHQVPAPAGERPPLGWRKPTQPSKGIKSPRKRKKKTPKKSHQRQSHPELKQGRPSRRYQ